MSLKNTIIYNKNTTVICKWVKNMIKDFWTEEEIEMSAEEYDKEYDKEYYKLKNSIITMRLK